MGAYVPFTRFFYLSRYDGAAGPRSTRQSCRAIGIGPMELNGSELYTTLIYNSNDVAGCV